jgi:alpha-D-ribose 1-methylphosphonate 5-triphosphate diphosphatase
MWLTDLCLVLPEGIVERGALFLEDGKIAEIVEGNAPEPGIALPGMMALPGLIDLHGDMLERDIEPRPGARFPIDLALYELDKRLAATGITTAFAAVSFAWTKDDLRSQEKAQEIIEIINARQAELLVDMRVHARFEITNPNTAPILERLLDAGLVDLVSLMDHTPGQGQYKNIKKYVDFMTRWLGFQPEAVGEDLMQRVEQGVEVEAAKPRDWSIVREVVEIARSRQVPIASHDDDTVEKVEQMAAFGVTISEFPVSEVAARHARHEGMHVLMGAPNAYRGESTSGNLSAMDAIRGGLVDLLATDYFPAAMLHSAFRLAERGVLPLVESVKLVSQNAAAAVGLHDRGRLEAGLKADLVLVENNPQASEHPRVRGTLRDGVFIYQDSVLTHLTRNWPLSIARE